MFELFRFKRSRPPEQTRDVWPKKIKLNGVTVTVEGPLKIPLSFFTRELAEQLGAKLISLEEILTIIEGLPAGIIYNMVLFDTLGPGNEGNHWIVARTTLKSKTVALQKCDLFGIRPDNARIDKLPLSHPFFTGFVIEQYVDAKTPRQKPFSREELLLPKNFQSLLPLEEIQRRFLEEEVPSFRYLGGLMWRTKKGVWEII